MDSMDFSNRCKTSGINLKSVFCGRKRFILIHLYVESEHYSIVAFSDSYSDLVDIRDCHPRYGSSRHKFFIVPNNQPLEYITVPDNVLWLIDIKDVCLINICKNVAEYLAVGEYAMLKKSYFKSSAWFEKAKNSAFLGAEIIDNY